MKEFTVGTDVDERRLDRWLASTFGRISMAQAQKIIRQEQVRVNGKHPKADARVHAGDVVRLYIPDEWFEPPEQKNDPFYGTFRWKLDVVYEDENVLLVDKRPGLLCHADASEKVDTLVHHARAYLYQKGEWRNEKGAFAPSLCNRIDRFTGGVVLIAKNEEALRTLDQKLRAHEIVKQYLCIARGRFDRESGLLDGYLTHVGKRVEVSKRPSPGAQRAQTGFRVLCQRDGLALLECELFTGRTHQIRAQLAAAGHPLLGDAQYGRAEKGGRQYQALYAYRVTFAFQTDAGVLNGLRGKSFAVKTVPFAREYFPQYDLSTALSRVENAKPSMQGGSLK